MHHLAYRGERPIILVLSSKASIFDGALGPVVLVAS